MKKVFIKYNPYKLDTEITIDGQRLAHNSRLGEWAAPGIRLQEWVEQLPELLVAECNAVDFDVVFHGTLMDYEDLVEVFTAAYEKGMLTARLERKPAKETGEKEALIDEVFQQIQKGPFDELRDEEVKNAFDHAKSSDFEVCVVATMSAGKSTLINAMLGTKLMPSRQEACTAIITRLKDNDKPCWNAVVCGKDGREIEKDNELTYQIMERLNSDQNVSTIKASGNIPFVTAEDVSLVLIDTPGPNNSRDPEHKKIQNGFLSRSSKSLVLYIMEGTFGSDDDNDLLDKVAESMAVGGKQSKDRFIFVVNKMDDRRKEDGDTAQMLNRVKAYLNDKGIAKPNLFPVAALPALNIRLMTSGVEVDEDTKEETEMKVGRLCRNDYLHLEKYATLPNSIKDKIQKERLEPAVRAENKEGQALVHTGIPSLEAAISQYVRKYAKTAKIRNIVDTFKHKLDEVDCFEKTKRELASRQDESEEIVRKINTIQQKIDDAQLAQNFKDAVDLAVKKTEDDSRNVVENIVGKFEKRITQRIDEAKGSKLEVDKLSEELNKLNAFVKKLEPDFQYALDELLYGNLVKTGRALLEEYRQKIISLSTEIGLDNDDINIEPIKLIGGSISSAGFSFSDKYIHEEKVQDGEEWIKNTDKKWYKPWTWFQEEGYYRAKYVTKKYIYANELAYDYLSLIKKNIIENGENAKLYAFRQSNIIMERFSVEFSKLDKVLKNKLDELKDCVSDKQESEKLIRESEYKLAWLNYIKTEVENILEI